MSTEALVFGFFIVIIGLCVGSFLNVVILRGFSGESIVFPPSKCPKCGKRLNWYTNIPVISYLCLRGKCQFCKSPISLQYPIVEALNAILYLTMYLNFGLSLKTLFLCALSSIFILLAVCDLKERVIFDIHTYIMIALGLLYNFLHLGTIPFLDSILGIAAGYLIFEIMARFGILVAGHRAFGEGDTLIAMGLGAFFGWKYLLVIIFLSIVLQAAFALPALIFKHIKNKEYKNASALILVIISFMALKINQSLYFTLFVCAVLVWCLYVILRGLRDKKDTDNFYMLPFGPALVISALIMIFYSPQIINLLR